MSLIDKYQGKLKKCPFCGEEVELVKGKQNLVWVVCKESENSCKHSGLIICVDNRNEEDFLKAIQQWNQRHED